jgi:hypothetical protein
MNKLVQPRQRCANITAVTPITIAITDGSGPEHFG